jgi:hypothetical protein
MLERSRISSAMDIEKAMILAESLNPVVDALLVDRVALEERFWKIDEAVKGIGDMGRRMKDDAVMRRLLSAQNGMLDRLFPHSLDSDRVAAASAARAAEALHVRGSIDAFMSALGNDPAAKLDLNGGAS